MTGYNIQFLKNMHRLCSDIILTNTETNINTKTRCSAIAERPRCRVRYSFRQK